MLVYSDGDARQILSEYPALDRNRTEQFVKAAFPKQRISYFEDGNLYSTCPSGNELVAGCFQGTTILSAEEFGIDYPSRLDAHFLNLSSAKTVYLLAMHSVVDFFAFAVWKSGKLNRSLSVSPDSGILEDIGDKLAFESPFWRGDHPAFDKDDDEEMAEEYPLKFNPLEFGEATLSNMLGYSMEGPWPTDILDPEKVQLMNFKRKKPFLGLF